MTLEQAIIRAQEKARELGSREHQQIADWLRELQTLRRMADLSERDCDHYNL